MCALHGLSKQTECGNLSFEHSVVRQAKWSASGGVQRSGGVRALSTHVGIALVHMAPQIGEWRESVKFHPSPSDQPSAPAQQAG